MPVPTTDTACFVCGAPIPPASARHRTHCEQIECRLAYQRRLRGEVDDDGHARLRRALCGEAAERDARWVEQTEPQRDELRRAHADLTREGYLLAVVPSMRSALVPQRADEIVAFMRYLDEQIDRSGDVEVEPSADDVATGATGAHQSRLLQAACTACGGHCCRGGGTTAHLRPVDLKRVMSRESVDAAETRALYRAHCPAERVEGSCMFHGATGCGLPRPFRSQTCNEAVCFQVRGLFREADRQRVPGVVLGAWAGDRSAVIDF